MTSEADLEGEIKRLIVETLRWPDLQPEMIGAELPLFDHGRGGLGLDSLDGLGIAAALSRRYGIRVLDGDPSAAPHFESVRSLGRFVGAALAGSKAGAGP
jgi:acyl carrier protein